MLINLSNHPVSKWSNEQLSAAQTQFGEVVDLPFPIVDPRADENQVGALVDEYLQKVIYLSKNQKVAVHLMGEMNFSFALVARLQNAGFICVASTTQRIVYELPDGGKEVQFKFVQFRKYV